MSSSDYNMSLMCLYNMAACAMILLLIATWSMCMTVSKGPPRFERERRFGDRDGYRGGPRGPGGDLGDKGGAPADYRPYFGVNLLQPLYHDIIVICGNIYISVLKGG